MTAIKFCGVTQPEDAAVAASIGAAYVGTIFAGGPRLVSAARAAEVLAQKGTARGVGVFGYQSVREIAHIASEAALDIVQLHGDPDAQFIASLRPHFAGEVWAVVRTDGMLPADIKSLFDCADAVLFDAQVTGQFGGTGVRLPWDVLAPALAPLRGRRARLVLAGGLTPDNVAQAIATIAPDVVDVASGVERAPGLKDHDRMRAFARAVHSAEAVRA